MTEYDFLLPPEAKRVINLVDIGANPETARSLLDSPQALRDYLLSTAKIVFKITHEDVGGEGAETETFNLLRKMSDDEIVEAVKKLLESVPNYREEVEKLDRALQALVVVALSQSTELIKLYADGQISTHMNKIHVSLNGDISENPRFIVINDGVITAEFDGDPTEKGLLETFEDEEIKGALMDMYLSSQEKDDRGFVARAFVDEEGVIRAADDLTSEIGYTKSRSYHGIFEVKLVRAKNDPTKVKPAYIFTPITENDLSSANIGMNVVGVYEYSNGTDASVGYAGALPNIEYAHRDRRMLVVEIARLAVAGFVRIGATDINRVHLIAGAGDSYRLIV